MRPFPCSSSSAVLGIAVVRVQLYHPVSYHSSLCQRRWFVVVSFAHVSCGWTGETIPGDCVHGVTVAGTSSVSGQLKRAIHTDPILGRLYRHIQRGWPDQALKPYKNRHSELTVEGGYVMWGIHAIVPNKLRQAVLDMLHEGHQGIVRMKSLAHSYVWWPGLDEDFTKLAKECSLCQQVQKLPAPVPLHLWLWPEKPWAQVHLDFAGQFRGHTFLIAVDAHSKWPEVVQMTTTTSTHTITVLSLWTSAPTHYRQRSSIQFFRIHNLLCSKWHQTCQDFTVPSIIQQFGWAFRAVIQIAMKKSDKVGLSLSHHLAIFLLSYHTTPHATTDVATCVLFLGRFANNCICYRQPLLMLSLTNKQLRRYSMIDAVEHKSYTLVNVWWSVTKWVLYSSIWDPSRTWLNFHVVSSKSGILITSGPELGPLILPEGRKECYLMILGLLPRRSQLIPTLQKFEMSLQMTLWLILSYRRYHQHHHPRLPPLRWIILRIQQGSYCPWPL